VKVLTAVGVTQAHGKQMDLEWPEFKDLVRLQNNPRNVETDSEKRASSWFSLAEYRGGHRRRENLIGRPEAIVADLDRVDDPAGVLKALKPYEYIAWDTWNSTPEHPRWRVVLPVRDGVSKGAFSRLVEQTLQPLNGYAKIDPKSMTPEQLWFFPVHKQSQRRHHRVWENHGSWIDGASVSGVRKVTSTKGNLIHVDFTGVVNVTRPEGVGKGDRNNSLVRRLTLNDALLCESKGELEELAREWNERLTDPMDRREVMGIVRKTWNWMQRGSGVAKRAEAWKASKEAVEVGTTGVGMFGAETTRAEMPDSLVGDFLYPGATMLSAKMKEGKSYLAMQLALSVVSGVAFLRGKEHDGFAVNRKVKSVVLALEDSPAGINHRFHGNIAAGHLPRPGGKDGTDLLIVYLEQLEKLRAGHSRKIDGRTLFEGLVQAWYNKGYRLIFIDPLAAMEAALGINGYPGTEGVKNIHKLDFLTMRYFTSLAQRYDDMHFVISMHHGKSKTGHDEQDPGDMIAGTTGFGAGAVTTISLLPIPGTLEAQDEDEEGVTKRRTLYIHGRYTREHRLLVEQDKKLGIWRCLGKVSDNMVSDAQEKYFRAMVELGAEDAPVTGEAIRKQLGNSVSLHSVHVTLKRAINKGIVVFGKRCWAKKGPGGGYRLRAVGDVSKPSQAWLLKTQGYHAK
jgi:hypothetical protein